MRYALEEKQPQERDLFIVRIVGDSNDGDYVTTENSYSKKVFEKFVLDELIHLNNYTDEEALNGYNNNGISEYLHIPYNGHDGYCHTLVKVVVEYIDKDGKTFTVKY